MGPLFHFFASLHLWMYFLLIGLAWSVWDPSEYQSDILCYAGSDPTTCKQMEMAYQQPDGAPKGFTFSTVTADSTSTCFDNLGSYPVLVWLTAGTTGKGNDYFDLSKMKKNHIIEFVSFSGIGMNSPAQLQSHLLRLKTMGWQGKSGMVAGNEHRHRFIKTIHPREADGGESQFRTVHIKDTSTEADLSKVDCVFFSVCNVQLMSEVKVQAAVAGELVTFGKEASGKLKTSYFLCRPDLLNSDSSVLTLLEATSLAVYDGGEDSPDDPMLSRIVFRTDSWDLYYDAGDLEQQYMIPSTVIQKDGQFSVLQMAPAGKNVPVSFELDKSGEATTNGIAGGLNLSIQREDEVPTSALTTPPDGGSPSMTVTFTGDWNEVKNIAAAEFVFEGTVTLEGQPTSAKVEHGDVSARPNGPGLATAPKVPIDKPINVPLIVGCTVAAVVVVVAIIVGVVLFLRHKKKGQGSESSGKEEQPAE